MFDQTMVNGPPGMSEQLVVAPILAVQRCRRLGERDRSRDILNRRTEKRRKTDTKRKEEDILFESYLGKLFDYSA